jgi:hypothetical protein
MIFDQGGQNMSGKQLIKFLATGFLAAFLGFAGSGLGLAQEAVTGTFRGVVTDSSGAIVPNAKVKAQQIGTGLVREAQTNELGSYVIPGLPPGEYELTASAPSFSSIERPSVQLMVAQDETVDFKLAVGSTTQTLQVTSEPPALTTTPAAIGTVISQQQVADLPLNGRQFTQLILLTPGASPHPGGQQSTFTVSEGAGGISPAVNGQRGTQNNYTLDGIPNNSLFFDSWAISPPPDAIAEFKVQSQIVDGQLNMSSGANVNLVVKSGTDELHGNAWEFVRNNVLNARNAFDTTKPPYTQNQYGVTIGGPVFLPHYDGREKHTYFFGYWEGFRSSQGVTQQVSVPTAAARSGDFSGFLGPQIGTDDLGRPVLQGEIFNPYTARNVTAGTTDPVSGLMAVASGLVTDPFPGNVIPQSMIMPQSQFMMNHFYPMPNLPGETNNLKLANQQTVDNDQFGVKIDQVFRNNDTFNGAFYRSKPSQLTPTGLPVDPSRNSNQTDSVGIGYTHLFDPTLLLTARYGYTYSNWQSTFGTPGSTATAASCGVGQFFPERNGIPLCFWNVPSPQYTDAQQFSIPLGPQKTNSVSVDVAKTKGNHELGAGILYFHLHSFDDGWGMQANWSPVQTMEPGFFNTTGNAGASWLLGLNDSTAGQVGDTSANFSSNWWGGYLQDKWKVSSKLWLQVAVRYDFVSPPSFYNGFWSGIDWDEKIFRVTQPVPPQFPVANIRSTWFDPQYNGIQPRFGFAYNVSPKTVVRGAFAIFDDHDNNWIEPIQGGREKWPYAATVVGLVNQQNIQPASVACRTVNGTPTCGPDTILYNYPASTTFYGPNSPVATGPSTNPRERIPYAMEYNLTVERAITQSLTLDVGYVGSLGRHLFVEQTVNTAPEPGTGALTPRLPLPNFSPGFTYANNIANSTYNALQIKLDKRFSNGLTFLASYTYSKCLDPKSDAFSGLGVDAYDLRRFWGRCDFDLRHIFVFSSIYQLPFGKGRTFLANASGVEDAFLGGWDIGGIVSVQSGLPFTVGVTGDPANVGSGAFQTAELVGNPDPPGFKRTTQEWFDTSAFAEPTFGTFGNSGRNILNFPAYRNVDFYASKNFAFTERLKLQFRAEFFNIFNHPTYGQGYSGVGGGQVMDVGTPSFGQLLSASPPRIVQFGMKFFW